MALVLVTGKPKSMVAVPASLPGRTLCCPTSEWKAEWQAAPREGTCMRGSLALELLALLRTDPLQ